MDDIVKDGSVCIIGMGYVGLTLATVMADVGFDVVGIEIRDDILSDLKKGKSHFYEKGIDDKLSNLVSKNKLSF